ncbi:MAG: exosortase system-associated protein, TIGR04073 family [Verrucomicrobiales bacterium]
MKKLFLILVTLAIAGTSVADIQAPPGAKYRRVGKLSRGLANIVYGFIEIPHQWTRENDSEGSSHSASYGLLWGAHKTAIRLAWGLYEVATAPFPTYKGGFKAPFKHKQRMNPQSGYTDFPPELGFDGGADYNRFQNY